MAQEGVDALRPDGDMESAWHGVRDKPSLGYDEIDSFFLLRGSPIVEGNTGAGSDAVGYNFGHWDNSKFTNNTGHAVQQVRACYHMG